MKTYNEIFGLGKKKQLMAADQSEPLKVKDEVEIMDKYSSYDGETGVIVKVGSGSTEGYFMVKFDDGQVTPFSRERLNLLK